MDDCGIVMGNYGLFALRDKLENRTFKQNVKADLFCPK